MSWANDHANYGDPEDQCDNKDSDHHSVSLWLGYLSWFLAKHHGDHCYPDDLAQLIIIFLW